MRTRATFAASRIRVGMQSAGVASDITVQWTNIAGGTLDAGTQAVLGGVETPMSGTLRAFGLEEQAQTVERKFAEIQVGDLILDTPSPAMVNIFPGQIMSGTIALDALDEQGARFVWNGRVYAQAKIGAELAAAWEAIVGNTALYRTILLRRAT